MNETPPQDAATMATPPEVVVETVTAPAAEAMPAEASAAEAEAPVEAVVPGADADVPDASPATAGEADASADSAAPAETPGTPELSPAATGKRLAELFPALFGTEVKPIKLRIQADLQQRAPGVFTRKGLSLFLHRHTTSTPYLKSLIAAPTRFDLDGTPSGEIAEEHREAARVEVARRRQIVDERRAAERKAARESQNAEQRAAENVKRREEHRARQEERKKAAAEWEVKKAEGLAADIEADRQRALAQAQRQQQRAPERGHAPHANRQAPQGKRGDHRAHQPHPQPHHQPLRHEQDLPAQPPTTPEQRDRAALLRAYETSTLTRSNFLVLKRMTGEQLDEQLALARAEAKARGPAPQRPR